jgi:hypothetical protein
MGKKWRLFFFFDEAYRRIIESQHYIRNVFKEIYTGSLSNPKRPDLRARESIIGEYIRDRDLQLKTISSYNLDEEDRLRWMSWFDFNFHILALKRRNDAIEQD